MKLYFSPGACSLSPHIVLHELGLSAETEQVDLKAKRTKSGADYPAITPKGAVPALQLDDGKVLTEGAVIVQYLADQKPGAELLPPAGTIGRYRVQEWLNYIASEIHKGFSPLFRAKTDAEKQAPLTALEGKLDYVAKQLEGKQFLHGEKFSVADAYLFTVLRWSKKVGPDLSRWPALGQFMERIGQRPGVKAAMAAEGLDQA